MYTKRNFTNLNSINSKSNSPMADLLRYVRLKI